jgi:Rad3-related DNA helicase
MLSNVSAAIQSAGAATAPAEPPSVAAQPPPDAVNTVGLALIAYGVVQILGKLVERLPIGRGSPADRARHADGFNEEDRKRIERSLDLAAAESQRLQRMQELLETQQRLVGQALDELRVVNTRLESVVRKLRALWSRFGRRKDEPN